MRQYNCRLSKRKRPEGHLLCATSSRRTVSSRLRPAAARTAVARTAVAHTASAAPHRLHHLLTFFFTAVRAVFRVRGQPPVWDTETVSSRQEATLGSLPFSAEDLWLKSSPSSSCPGKSYIFRLAVLT